MAVSQPQLLRQERLSGFVHDFFFEMSHVSDYICMRWGQGSRSVFVLLSSSTTFCTDLGWELVPSSLCVENGVFAQAYSTLPRISVTHYSIFSCASGLPSSSVMLFSLELETVAK